MRKRSEANDDKPVVEIPHDPFNEQIVIAAMLVDGQLRDRYVPRLNADRFKGDGHADIVKALKELKRQGLDYDPATLRQVGGEDVDVDYLRELAAAHPGAPPNFKHHVATIEWDHSRAQAVVGPIGGLLRSLQDPTTDPQRVRALARMVPLAFDGKGRGSFMHDPDALVREQMADVRSRRTDQAVFPYGIEGFDEYPDGEPRIIPGAKPGKVTLVTAVSGAGKSTIAGIMALGLARQRRRVLFGAWEQGGGLTLELIALQSLGWSKTIALTGGLTEEMEDELEARMRAISAYIRFWPLPFGHTPGDDWTNREALDAIHNHIAESGCDVAFYDLFERALEETSPSDERKALYRLQKIHEVTHTHGVILHQLRLKDVERRTDPRPTREAVFGTAAWVEVPDTIVGIHNEAVFRPVENDTLELLLLKQRFGKWPQAVEFDWDPEYGLIKNGRPVDYAGRAGAEKGIGSWAAKEKRSVAASRSKPLDD